MVYKYISILLLLTSFSLAEMVVVVHPSLNIQELKKETVKKIFLARVKKFSTGDRITLVDQELIGAGYKTFYDKVAHKSVAKMTKYWVKLRFTGRGTAPVQVENSLDVLELIKSNKNMIGYMEKSLVTKDVKIVYTLP